MLHFISLFLAVKKKLEREKSECSRPPSLTRAQKTDSKRTSKNEWRGTTRRTDTRSRLLLSSLGKGVFQV